MNSIEGHVVEGGRLAFHLIYFELEVKDNF